MSQTFFNLPIAKNQSIYKFLHRQLDPQTNRLPDSGVTLPDDKSRFGAEGLRWAAGALDGVLGHHSKGDEAVPVEIVSHMTAIAEQNSLQAKMDLYELLREDGVLGYVDQVLEQLAETKPSVEPYLYDFMRLLLKQASDRGPVKFAIAVLGVIAAKPEIPLITLFGMHDEFTLYTAVALTNILEEVEAEQALWNLAQRVKGWGRIQIVERLAHTDNPEIQDWLVCEGFRNDIMHEYLSLICAETGRLAERLNTEEGVDEELLLAAAEIFDALGGGPAAGIESYEDGPDAVEAYLRLVTAQRPRHLMHYVAVHTLLTYLQEPELTPQWPEAARAEDTASAEAILAFDLWHTLAMAGLQSDDQVTFWLADRAAGLLGIETWDIHWDRLLAQSGDSVRWHKAIDAASEEKIAVVVGFAEKALPLAEIGSGPADELGTSKRFEWHHCLGAVLQALRGRPRLGEPLVVTALRSPIVRHRNVVLGVLESWGQQNWSAEIATVLKQAHSEEPREDVRRRMTCLLAGEPLDSC